MKIDLNTILIIALIAVVVLMQKCGGGNKDIKALIAAKDSVIAEKQKQIDGIKEENKTLDKAISAYDKRDSLFTEYFKTRPQVYKKLDDQLKNIPIRIAAIANSDDSIHSILSR